MQQQTFRATGFETALARVREELGPDAVILSSRPVKGGVEIRAARHDAESQGTALLERRLERMGVPRGAAVTLALALRDAHGGVPATLGQARPALGRVLEDEMIFAGGIADATRTAAFVGPTGAGKTTTLAKIAAHAALVDRRRVAVVCLDQYRIAGAELVLIDTAGRSPRDRDALVATGSVLRQGGEPIEAHLCLPANVGDIELRAIVELHTDALRPRRLIATKVDEAVYHGSIVAAQVHAGIPYSYFTTGQRVPEDIEVASAERLAGLLCGDGVFA